MSGPRPLLVAALAAGCGGAPPPSPAPPSVPAAPSSAAAPPSVPADAPDCPIEREAIEKRYSSLRVSAECMPVVARARDLSFVESASVEQRDAAVKLDLRPLARATGLGSISLQFRSPPDFAPLAKLPELEDVWIRNELGSLAPLAPLVQLRRLHIQPIGIGAIEDLSALRQLRRLEGFFSNQIFDLAALAEVSPGLSALDASFAKNLSALSRFTKLESLVLDCLEPGDRLPEPPKLRSLTLRCHDQEPALEALASFPSLTELDLSGTGARSLGPLRRLPRLQRLDLHGLEVDSLAPLAGLRELVWLDIHGTGVKSFAPLAGLPKLEFLDAGGVPATSVAPLAACRSLRELYLPATGVRSVLPLARVRTLRELMVPRGCDAPDVRALHRARPDIRFLMWLDKSEPEDPTCHP